MTTYAQTQHVGGPRRRVHDAIPSLLLTVCLTAIALNVVTVFTVVKDRTLPTDLHLDTPRNSTTSSQQSPGASAPGVVARRHVSD